MRPDRPPVEIYTTPFCPYCRAAKGLLVEKGVEFTEIDVSRDPEKRRTMSARAGGRRTVPQIFIGDRHVGGCDELYSLDGEGRLDALLQQT
jgi:glutaredoxin 3